MVLMSSSGEIVKPGHFARSEEFYGKIYYNGEPCYHKGCINHITHPCEVCGRIGAKGTFVCTDYKKIFELGENA